MENQGEEMVVLYIHGFGSRFDPEGGKASSLKALGKVIGYDVDYTEHFDVWFPRLVEYAEEQKVDLLAGTSMGGFTVSHLSKRLGVPFVALNPAIEPAVTLLRHLGEGTTYHGTPFHLTKGAAASYPNFATDGTGVIFLETGDVVIDWRKTQATLSSHYPVKIIEGGSHRFESLGEQVDEIRRFCAFCKDKKG